MLRAVDRFCVPVSHRLSSRIFSKKPLGFTEILNMATPAPLLYHSVEPILKVFKEHKDINGVQELLTIYENASEKKLKHEAPGEIRKHPLIVLEGLDGSGKSTIGKRVAKKNDAIQWRTPPNSISHLRNLFDDHPVLRTAFYSLGNYIAALEVQLLLINQPIIMDRYWHSTAAFAIAQAVQDHPDRYSMPPASDKIYSWPEDLFKPDIVFLLNVSEKVRLERHSRRQTVTTQEDLLKSSTSFRENIITAYQNMYNPRVENVNGDYSFGSVLGHIDRKVKNLLN